MYGHGQDWESLIKNIQFQPLSTWTPILHKSFKIQVNSFGNSIALPQQIQMINRFSFLPLKGRIDLKSPEIKLAVICDYGFPEPDPVTNEMIRASEPQRIFFGLSVLNLPAKYSSFKLI